MRTVAKFSHPGSKIKKTDSLKCILMECRRTVNSYSDSNV